MIIITKYQIAKIRHQLLTFFYAMSLGIAMILAAIITSIFAILICITMYIILR